MTPNLKNLIKEGEGATLDFKTSISQPEKIARNIVAFANSKGGIILVGVHDDGQVVGCFPEEEKFMLHEAAAQYCQPTIELIFEEVETDNNLTVLLVRVAESKQKPHACVSAKGEWRVYVRSGDQCVPASKPVTDVLRKTYNDELPTARDYTKHEKTLFEYLQKHSRIIASDYAQLLNISERRATRILTELVRNGELYIHTHAKKSYYTAA